MTLAPPAPMRQPAPTAPPSPRRTVGVAATAGTRAGAYLIDVAIVGIAATLVWVTTGSLVLMAVTALELWAIGWIWEGHTGATPGNLMCGIRTVQRDKDLSVGARGLFLRSLVLGVSHIIPVLLPVGLAASGALDPLARARVIDVRKTRGTTASASPMAPDLEARVTGPDAAPGVVASVPGVITQTPLTPAPMAPPEPAPAPVPLDAGSLPVFELSDGTVIEATGLGYIGRAPRAPETIPDAILVRVPDGSRSLSRTHVAFGIEDDQLWVQDLGSANGASVRHLGGSVTALIAHNPYFLVPGDVLVLGNDAELSYRRVAGRAPRQAKAPSAPAAARPAATAPAAAPIAQSAAPGGYPGAPMPQAGPAAQQPAQAARLRRGADALPPIPSPAQSVIALRFADGVTVPVRGPGYIGRAPRLPEGERTDAALIAVPNGDRSVSRTHGRFGIVDGQTWFEDLGSGNGSSLRTVDGRSGPMTPHQRFGLIPGMTLQLGDCVIGVIAL